MVLNYKSIISIVAIILINTQISHSIVSHIPMEDPGLSQYVAKWGNNASGVLVHPNFVLSTKHQGGSTNTVITIDNIKYQIAKRITHPTADLSLALIFTENGNPASLNDWVQIHTSSHGTDLTDFIIGGFGRVAGQHLIYTPDDPELDIHYGYGWASNSSLNFGTNRAYTIGFANGASAILSRFSYGTGSTEFEAIAAMGDSGGPWFIDHGDHYTVSGLTIGLSQLDKSVFRSVPGEKISIMYGARVTAYTNWINNTIEMHNPIFGDTNLDGKVDDIDLLKIQSNIGKINANWFDGDFDGDETVTLYDAYLLFKNYNNGMQIPEPASFILLGASFILLLQRFKNP